MYTRRTALAFGLVVVSGSLASGQTIQVNVDSAGHHRDCGFWPSISADGRLIAFMSDELVPGDTNQCMDIFVRDHVAGVTERDSVDSSGGQANGGSEDPAISSTGQFVAFVSLATNLVSGDTNNQRDIFVHDRVTGSTECVSVDSSGAQGDGDSTWPSISADGRYVAFDSVATNLVPGDTNGKLDVFVHDRSTGSTVRVSVDSFGAQANGSSNFSFIADGGQVVVFQSDAPNLVAGDTNSWMDIFLHDLSTGTTERVNVDSSGAQADSMSLLPVLSADGSVIAFESDAGNLVAGDTNGHRDVFVRDRAQGITERVSIDSSGAEGNDWSATATISGDGSLVGFTSQATNLVSNDNNDWDDVFVHSRVTGITERVSVDSSGNEGDNDSGFYLPSALSSDGLVIAFQSNADNFARGDINAGSDVFIHDLCSTPAAWSNYGAGFPGSHGVPTFTSQQNPAFATTITLDLENSYGNPTVGVLFVGFQQTSIHSNWGGDLLVVPSLVVPTSFSYGYNSYAGEIPDDWSLCGMTLDLQALEADPGAAKGVSFTQGLQLILGR
jgi:Tol biopolymer transport system component